MAQSKKQKMADLEQEFQYLLKAYNDQMEIRNPTIPKLSWSGPVSKEGASQRPSSRGVAELSPEDRESLLKEIEENMQQRRALKHSRFDHIQDVRTPSTAESFVMGFEDEFLAGLGDEFMAAVETLATSEDEEEIEGAKKRLQEVEKKETSYYRKNWERLQRKLELSETYHPTAMNSGRVFGTLAQVVTGGLLTALGKGSKLYKILSEGIKRVGPRKMHSLLKAGGEAIRKVPLVSQAFKPGVTGAIAEGAVTTFGQSGSPMGTDSLDWEVATGGALSGAMSAGMRALLKGYRGKVGDKVAKGTESFFQKVLGDLTDVEISAVRRLSKIMKHGETTEGLASEALEIVTELHKMSRAFTKEAIDHLADEKTIPTDELLGYAQRALRANLEKDPKKVASEIARMAREKRVLGEGRDPHMEPYIQIEGVKLPKPIQRELDKLGVPPGHFPIGLVEHKAVKNLLGLVDDLSHFGPKVSEKELYRIRVRIDDNINWQKEFYKAQDKLSISFRKLIDNRLKRNNGYKENIGHTAEILQTIGTGNRAKDKEVSFMRMFNVKTDGTGSINIEEQTGPLGKKLYDLGNAAIVYQRGRSTKEQHTKKFINLYKMFGEKLNAINKPRVKKGGKTEPSTQRDGWKAEGYTDDKETDLIGGYSLPPFALSPERSAIRNLPKQRLEAAALNDHFERHQGRSQGSRKTQLGKATVGGFFGLLGMTLFGEQGGWLGTTLGGAVGAGGGAYLDTKGRDIGKWIASRGGKRFGDNIGESGTFKGTSNVEGVPKPQGPKPQIEPVKPSLGERLGSDPFKRLWEGSSDGLPGTGIGSMLPAHPAAAYAKKPWSLEEEERAEKSRGPQSEESSYRDSWREEEEEEEVSNAEQEQREKRAKVVKDYIRQQRGGKKDKSKTHGVAGKDRFDRLSGDW